MIYRSILCLAVATLLAGCAGGGKDTTSMGKTKGAPPSLIINTDLASPSGDVLGKARVTQEPEGTRIAVSVNGLPPGTYAVHLHAVGRCDGQTFTATGGQAFAAAGGHFNPAQKQHGTLNPAGAHAGDLPNIVIGDDRRGTLDVVQPGLRLADGDAPLIDMDGASIVIHAAPDDYRTDPAGNAGARIACGVLAHPRQPINPE